MGQSTPGLWRWFRWWRNRGKPGRRRRSVDERLGVLVPIHLLTAWFFLADTIGHVYMTTTGPTVTAHVRAMITGRESAGGHR